jgi:hypothetical protein
MHLQIENFLLAGLDLLLDEAAISEFGEIKVEIEDDHTVLPPLEGEIFGYSFFFELNEYIIADAHVVPSEERRKILPIPIGN